MLKTTHRSTCSLSVFKFSWSAQVAFQNTCVTIAVHGADPGTPRAVGSVRGDVQDYINNITVICRNLANSVVIVLFLATNLAFCFILIMYLLIRLEVGADMAQSRSSTNHTALPLSLGLFPPLFLKINMHLKSF